MENNTDKVPSEKPQVPNGASTTPDTGVLAPHDKASSVSDKSTAGQSGEAPKNPPETVPATASKDSKPGASQPPAGPGTSPVAKTPSSPITQPKPGSPGPVKTAPSVKPTLSKLNKISPKDRKAFFKKYKFLVMGGAFVLIGIGMWGGIKIFRGISKAKEAMDQQKTGGSQEAVAVNVLEVKQDRFQDTLHAVGTIAGGSEIELRFEVEGMIENFDFREGDKVRKGEIIARLNQRDSYLKMKRAELELDQYEKLYAIGGVARSKLEETRLAADLARSDLEKTIIRGPRDGIIGDKDAEVGEFVSPTRKIATLVNIETVLVRVGIIEKEIDKIFPGQKVVLTVDTYPGVEFTGKVENISPLVQGTSKTLTVEGRLDNEGGLLLPGMFARTRITIFEEENTIAIPNDALEKTQAGYRLYVVNKDNKAEGRNVEVGYISTQFSQILKGLAPGERVIIQKPQDLKDGSPVKVIEVQK
ncbi:MAG TPA: efflux RND transporter periplasmic adaptor subunit [Elusimicrobiota bacterium]|nr:efflux RND transporter periplasmic adaptor subunit [Elusimicrobiota bacterium]